jgi:hypothetical protein
MPMLSVDIVKKARGFVCWKYNNIGGIRAGEASTSRANNRQRPPAFSFL